MPKTLYFFTFFFFYKIFFTSFFLKNQDRSQLSFFFLFYSFSTNPVFFFKVISLKKKYIYNLNARPTFFFKATNMLSRFNFLYQNMQPSLQNSTLSKKNKERVFSIQKTFLFFKKIHLKNFFFFYSFKFLKRRHLRNFFNNFRKKSFLDLETFFANNFLRVLHRIFPFFNFFLLKKMVTRGLIFLNFKKVSHFFIQLRIGDFISIFFLNTLWSFFKKQVIKQSKHLFKIKKKIAAILKVKKNSSYKLASAHYSNNFKNLTVFFRKIPTWVEVDFLTFSFFIIKKNSLKSFFFFFNPYLYRLLEYK